MFEENLFLHGGFFWTEGEDVRKFFFKRSVCLPASDFGGFALSCPILPPPINPQLGPLALRRPPHPFHPPIQPPLLSPLQHNSPAIPVSVVMRVHRVDALMMLSHMLLHRGPQLSCL